MLKKLLLAVLVLGVGVIAAVSAPAPVSANQAVCPDGYEWNNGQWEFWDKIDGVNATSVTAYAPAGKLIAEVCYKASTTVKYFDVTPPASSVYIQSTVFNHNHKRQDISHYSLRLINKPPVVLVASASISILPATCEAGEKLVYGAISNATFDQSSTPNGTFGPADYKVTATANAGAKFEGNKTKITVGEGTLAGPRTDCHEEVADIKYGVVCSAEGAVVTLTNTGDADGDVTVNGEVINVAAGATVERTFDTTDAGLQITITIDEEVVYDELVTCDTGEVLGDTDVLPNTSGNIASIAIAAVASFALIAGLISLAVRNLLTRQ